MRTHRDAFISELKKTLPDSVFKSYEASDKNRYAVVWIRLSEKPNTRYSAGQNGDVYTITVHCVGNSEDSALWVQEKVNALTGTKLSVSGRAMHPVEYITGQECQLNEESESPLWWAVSQFDLHSIPA